MSDKELLELAAKACGLVGIILFLHPDGNSLPTLLRNDNKCYWCPLSDDGDAFRLAVSLKLRVTFWPSGIEVSTPDLYQKTLVRYDDVSGDEFAAARRAVVLAAAEIGKNM